MKEKEKDIDSLKVKATGPLGAKEEVKIKKTIRIDYSVFEWLIQESERVGLPYQSLINSILTQKMRQKSLEDRVKVIEEKLANF